MKKNMKVIIMTTKVTNGNNLTYRTVAPLNVTVADACMMRNIPMLSILSATTTAPMTETDALAYMQNDVLEQFLDPAVMIINCNMNMIAA